MNEQTNERTKEKMNEHRTATQFRWMNLYRISLMMMNLLKFEHHLSGGHEWSGDLTVDKNWATFIEKLQEIILLHFGLIESKTSKKAYSGFTF